MKKLLTAVSMLLVSGMMFVSAQTNPNCVILTNDMTLGSTDATTGGQVTMLQNFLQGRGFLNVKPGTAFGTFGAQTQRAVAAFQKNNGIISTGYAGPLTRANIQTISCAVGSQDTSMLPTTVIASTSQALLTFTSPFGGDLVIKNEKDLGVDWNLANGIVETFPVTKTFIVLDLVSSNGSVIASIGGIKLSQQGRGNRIENDFKKVLKGKKDEVIPSGQYKIKATLEYRTTSTTTADLALVAQARNYASESGWFSIVDPAPKPNIRFGVSPEFLTAAGTTTLTWSSATSSVCTLFNGVATTSIASSGTQIANVTQSTTYRVECSLTSAWPFAGNSYTTTEKRDREVQIVTGSLSATIASATVAGSPKVLTFSGSTNAPELGFRIINSASTVVYTSSSVTIRNGQYSRNVSASLFGGANGQYTIQLYGPTALTGSTVLASKTFTVSSTTTPVCNSEQNLVNGVCVGITTSFTCPNGTVVQVPAMLSGNTAKLAYCSTGTATITYRNFIASTQSSCNTLVTTAYGSLVKSCTVGGGCSLTGGLPTSTNPSANPTVWGACISSTATATATAPTVTTSFSPASISGTGNSTFSWSSTNAVSCDVSHPDGSNPWNGAPTSFSLPVSASSFPNGLTTTITCKNAAGVTASASASLTITNTSSTTYRNFISGTQSSCNTLVTTAYGSQVASCTIGGGCTLNGQVPSSTNPSANPTTWGACVSSNATANVLPTIVTTATSTPTVVVPPVVAVLPAEPNFTATCSRERETYKVELKWNRVTGSTNYPVRLKGPSFATNATQYSGASVVGFGVTGDSAPTGTSFTFRGLTATGTYQYWGHAWNAVGGWSTNTVKTVTCTGRTSSLDEDNQLAVAPTSPAVLGANASCVDLPYNFHRGNESQSVTNLQNFLISNGYLNDNATGFFGDKTVAAVKAYQGSKGLPMTGMVYGFTRDAIRTETCQ